MLSAGKNRLTHHQTGQNATVGAGARPSWAASGASAICLPLTQTLRGWDTKCQKLSTGHRPMFRDTR